MDDDGEFLRVEIRYYEGVKHFPEHVHPHPRAEKRLHVLSGKFRLTVDGGEHILSEGEELTVPAGARHRYRNVDETHVLRELRPPIAMEALVRTTSALAREEKTKADGTPNRLAMAVLLGTSPDTVYLTTPPIAVQKLLVTPLASIGRPRGYKPDHPAAQQTVTE